MRCTLGSEQLLSRSIYRSLRKYTIQSHFALLFFQSSTSFCRCELTPDAFDYDDASDGPLAFGDVGEVEEVEDDPDDDMPYNVSFNGRTHW